MNHQEKLVRKTTLTAIIFSAGTALASVSMPAMRPGLWEITTTTDSHKVISGSVSDTPSQSDVHYICEDAAMTAIGIENSSTISRSCAVDIEGSGKLYN